jgi:superfamily II DNA/RNA helicase
VIIFNIYIFIQTFCLPPHTCFSDFPWSNKVKEVLNSVFKLDEFRPLQHETINAVLSNEDVILIMPTGGGKSLCYQLPALVKNGNVKMVQNNLFCVSAFCMFIH